MSTRTPRLGVTDLIGFLLRLRRPARVSAQVPGAPSLGVLGPRVPFIPRKSRPGASRLSVLHTRVPKSPRGVFRSGLAATPSPFIDLCCAFSFPTLFPLLK